MLEAQTQGHAPQLDLLPVNDQGEAPMATHVAVQDGDWFDPDTWAGGEVPGEGALVHIPADVSVAYEGSSDAQLFIVRVDGDLSFTAGDGVATKMVVDTMVTAPASSLCISADEPTDGTVDIVFAEGDPAAHDAHYADLSAGDGVIGRHEWDPGQLSLGLVASGSVEVHGQEVTSGLRLHDGPVVGATSIILDAPDGTAGWEVGQQIIIGGMNYRGKDAEGHLISEDEVREISAVHHQDGKVVIEFEAPLEYDHQGPADPATGSEITGYVGNLSRNVTFSSAVADPDGDGMANRALSLGEDGGALDHYVTERGHVMFMHNDNVGVTNAAFFGLGRTDKSIPVDDYQTTNTRGHRLHEDNGVEGQYDPDVDQVIETPPDEIMNQRGRYALHIHEAGNGGGAHGGHMAGMEGAGADGNDQDGDGITNSEDADYFDGAYLEGNVVWGSPGWGIVQHASRAALDGNLVFDVAGSAFVAELGNETGRWQGNFAFGTYGAGDRVIGGVNDGADDFNEDSGFGGVGFYLKSRAIEVLDNVAHSSARMAFYFHNNGTDFAETATDMLGDDLAGLGDGAETIETEDVPVRHFDDNAAFAAEQGLRIITDPLDAMRKFSDAWSHMTDFTAVSMDEAGVSMTYSSKYIFENFLIFGTEEKMEDAGQQASAGFFFKASVADITILGGYVSDFRNAVTNWSQVGDRQEYRRGYWDPKDPTSAHPDVPAYDGMGAVDGIENPAWNLWNTTVIGLAVDDIDGVLWRFPKMAVEIAPGVYADLRGALVLDSVEDVPNAPGVEIELLGDSLAGGLVALWREGPDHGGAERPLAYQETAYLSQIRFADGDVARRYDRTEDEPGISDDIWSGTVLEFAKTDSLGRQVFLYGDFAPLDPESAELTATTNEKILFTREMIDGVLARDGYGHLPGVEDVNFVVMRMLFTDRLTGEIEVRKFLVALDQAWELPEGAADNGTLEVTPDMIVAPQYRVFENGQPVEGRAPIIPSELLAEEPGDTPPPTGDGGVVLRADANGGTLTGSAGDDLLLGGAGDDLLDGGAGADRLFGRDGDDAVVAGDGDDRLDGGAGDDRLSGNAGDDNVRGRDGADQLSGGDGADLLRGDAGNDTLAGDDGDDTLLGGMGDDVLAGWADADRLFGGDGADLLSGGDGADRVDGGAGDDWLLGDLGDDDLRGGDGADLIAGGAGNDNVRGGAGADSVSGDEGDDILSAGAGDDEMAGGAGADSLFGKDGADNLWGQDGADRLDGDAGEDWLSGGAGDDDLRGGLDDDWLAGDVGRDILSGDAGNDTLSGGDGADRLFGRAGNDVLAGGNGEDRLRGGAGDDRLAGGAGDDRVRGGDGADMLSGGDGIDFLLGEDGDDLIFADSDDTVFAGAGDDLIFLGDGAVRISGGDGVDTLIAGDPADYPDLASEIARPVPDGLGDDLGIRLDGIEFVVGDFSAYLV